tara:strand:- start:877 stop:1332 length:456 start_codon:yes stop_codon:yes gene_type:complete
MKNYKSMRGINLDLGKLLAQQEKNITVGNTASNARGDKLGRAGRVMKSADEIAREHYNRNNPNAVKAASIKLDDTPKAAKVEEPMAEDDWEEPVTEEIRPDPEPQPFSEPVAENTEPEWVEDADGNFVKPSELEEAKDEPVSKSNKRKSDK